MTSRLRMFEPLPVCLVRNRRFRVNERPSRLFAILVKMRQIVEGEAAPENRPSGSNSKKLEIGRRSKTRQRLMTLVIVTLS